MDIKGFALQASSAGRSSCQEETAVITQCISRRIPYKLCTRPSDRPEGFIPVGTVQWCENFLPKEVTVPNYYPEFLKDYFHRNIWRAEKWPLGKRVFIKPADRHKRFTGRITTGGYHKKKKGPYWCSDVVYFTNEWRYYIADGVVLIGEWYAGDEINTPDAPELNIKFPDGYCGAVDFGTLKTGELALVKVNAPYACEWYGKKHEIYFEWIVKGWRYMEEKCQAGMT